MSICEYYFSCRSNKKSIVKKRKHKLSFLISKNIQSDIHTYIYILNKLRKGKKIDIKILLLIKPR